MLNMTTDPIASRRQILAAAGAVVAASALGRISSAQPTTQPTPRPRAKPPEMPQVDKAAKPISVLILGGTGFIGPHQVQYARARGHRVSIANRGRTRPEIFEVMDIENS